MVKLYSQPSCGQCKMVHMLLDQKGIEYSECQDVDEMRSLGITHTPTLEVDEKLLVGKDIINWIRSK